MVTRKITTNVLNMSIEVLFSYEKERIRRPEDAIVCCLHSYMTVNGYKCIGSGEKVIISRAIDGFARTQHYRPIPLRYIER